MTNTCHYINFEFAKSTHFKLKEHTHRKKRRENKTQTEIDKLQQPDSKAISNILFFIFIYLTN